MLIKCGVGRPREPGAGGTCCCSVSGPCFLATATAGEHEDTDERLAFGGALGQAEASAVRGVLDQHAEALERRGTLLRKVWRAGPVLALDDQLFQIGGGRLRFFWRSAAFSCSSCLRRLSRYVGESSRSGINPPRPARPRDSRTAGRRCLARSRQRRRGISLFASTRRAPGALRQALPHRVRQVVAARASSEQVSRARIHGRVLEAGIVAALHRALFGLRGSRAAQHVSALDAEPCVANDT